jgi:hypothetical protein
MSIVIAYQNIEQLIFYNKEVQKKLPEFLSIFNTWHLAIRHPSLRVTSQKMLIELLSKLNDNHIQILSEHFKEEVKVDKVDIGVVDNFTISLEEAEDFLNKMPAVLKESHFIYRDENNLYISMWR